MESKVLYSPSLQRWVLLIRWIWYHLILIRPHLYLQLRSFLSVENLCIPQLDQISNSHLICRNSIIDVSRLCPSSRFLNSTNDTILLNQNTKQNINLRVIALTFMAHIKPISKVCLFYIQIYLIALPLSQFLQLPPQSIPPSFLRKGWETAFLPVSLFSL